MTKRDRGGVRKKEQGGQRDREKKSGAESWKKY